MEAADWLMRVAYQSSFNNRRFVALGALGILFLVLAACAQRPIIHDNVQLRALRASIVSHALKMRGKPYRYGGMDPRGFDCSGLVLYSFQQVGVQVPRTTHAQFRGSSPVYLQQIQPGDLVFYRINNSIVSHVGIYIGNGQFIHAPGQGRSVRTESLQNAYWQYRFVGAGNLLE